MEFNVRLGLHDQRDMRIPYLNVSKVILHPSYDTKTQANDIALIRLSKPVQFDRNARPICLPTNEEQCEATARSNDELLVAGWGRLGETSFSPTSPRLLQVTLPLVANGVCQRSYGGLVSDNHLCAGRAGKDACQGDSGGAGMLSDLGSPRRIQCGVVSWGLGCGRPQYPGVYTRVTKYISWIQENTKDAQWCLPISDPSGEQPPSGDQPQGDQPAQNEGPVQPNFPGCGIVRLNRQRRIVGGTQTQPLQYPWIVPIAYRGDIIGTGSLLALNLVLTSASKIRSM